MEEFEFDADNFHEADLEELGFMMLLPCGLDVSEVPRPMNGRHELEIIVDGKFRKVRRAFFELEPDPYSINS